jgi:DNA-binding response OmpR family regulator
VVDLRLGDGNGLDVVSALKRKRPDARAIVLTGYGNIATAVTAVKMGAVDYLSKPADADDVVAALLRAAPKNRTAAQPDVGRPRALGAHPAHLRDVQPQRLGKRRDGSTCTGGRCSGSGEARAAVRLLSLLNAQRNQFRVSRNDASRTCAVSSLLVGSFTPEGRASSIPSACPLSVQLADLELLIYSGSSSATAPLSMKF